MAPGCIYPTYTSQTKWTLMRAWPSPSSMVSGKVIWPWHMAWRRRKDTMYGGVIQPGVDETKDEWVTEDEYLVLKLKGEV